MNHISPVFNIHILHSTKSFVSLPPQKNRFLEQVYHNLLGCDMLIINYLVTNRNLKGCGTQKNTKKQKTKENGFS